MITMIIGFMVIIGFNVYVLSSFYTDMKLFKHKVNQELAMALAELTHLSYTRQTSRTNN